MSFDANMRNLPKGKLFFAEVYSCIKGSDLYEYDIRKGDLLYCEMMSHCSEDPVVCIKTDYSGNIMTWDSKDTDLVWLVYTGNVDGTGFICDSTRDNAMQLMEER